MTLYIYTFCIVAAYVRVFIDNKRPHTVSVGYLWEDKSLQALQNRNVVSLTLDYQPLLGRKSSLLFFPLFHTFIR